MSKAEKNRVRNFSYLEKECLFRIIINKYGAILEDKKTNKVSMEEKNEIWKKIEAEFNSSAPVECFRKAEQLKRLYENKKKDLRKKIAQQKKERYLTGGGPPPADLKLDGVEELLLQIINEKSVFGFDSEFDSDNLGVKEPVIKKKKYDDDDDAEFEIFDFGIDHNEVSDNNIDVNCEDDIIRKINTKAATPRCAPLHMQAPINKKLRIQPLAADAQPSTSRVVATRIQSLTETAPGQTSVSPSRQNLTSRTNANVEENAGVAVETRKTFSRRRRPVGGIRALTSSDVGEKYNVLLDKRLVLVDKQVEQIVELQNFAREEQKLKLRVLKQQEENLILEKEEKKLKLELLKLDIKYKESLLFSKI